MPTSLSVDKDVGLHAWMGEVLLPSSVILELDKKRVEDGDFVFHIQNEPIYMGAVHGDNQNTHRWDR